MKFEVDIEVQTSLQAYMGFKPPLLRTSLEAYNYRLQFPSLKVENYLQFQIRQLKYVVYKATSTSNSTFHSRELVYKLTSTSIPSHTVFMAAMIPR